MKRIQSTLEPSYMINNCIKGEVHPDKNFVVKIAEKIIKNIGEGLRNIH